MANLVSNPEDFSAGTWTGGDYTVTTNTHVAPDGNTTADTVTFNTAFQPIQTTDITVSASTQYTASFYAKSGTATALNYDAYDQTNAAFIVGTTDYFSLINSSTWTRVTFTFTTPVGCVAARVFVGRNSGAGTVFLWGAYLNTGATAEDYPGVGGSSTKKLMTLGVG